jgi:hypothetical protein
MLGSTAEIIFIHPFLKLFPEILPPMLGSNLKDIAFFDVFDGFDWIDKLKNKGSSAFKHPHVDILTSSRVESDLYFFFLLVRIKQLEDAVFDFLLKAALGELLAIDQPRSLREISRKFDISTA